MKFNHVRLLTISVLGLLTSCSIDGTSPKKINNSIPIPTEAYSRMEDEAGFEQKKEGWLNLIHQSAPEDNWRAINAQNFQKLMGERRILKASKATETFANGLLEAEWVERGSKNQAGNLRIVDFEPQSEQIYGVADNGSLWRSNLAGTSWTILNNDEIFSKKVINAFELSAGTRRIIASKGSGLWYSDDEGLTWIESTGISSPNGDAVDLVRLNDASNTIVYIYNLAPLIGGPSNYVSYSIDNGETFTTVQTLSPAGANFASMVRIHDASITYILDKTNNLYKFEGTDLTLVNNNLNINASSNVKMVGAINATDTILYILKDRSDLYRSTDAGLTFSFVSTLPTNTWDVGIGMATDDVNAVYYGEMELYYSLDGGQNFNLNADWWEYYGDVTNKIHADIMDIESFQKTDGTEFTLIPNHGGINISYDHLQTTTNIGLDGLNIGQFYDVVTSPVNSEYIFGGTQDQGFQRAVDANSTTGTLDFEQVISGDYGHLQFSNGGNAIWIQYPGADFSVFGNAMVDGGATAWYNLDGNDMPAYDWIVPTASAPNLSDNYIYVAGGNSIGTNGSYMVKLIFDGANILTDQFDFDFKAESGGLIAALNASKFDAGKLYVGTDNGKFYFSNDEGLSWTQSQMNTGPSDYWLYGSAIASANQTSNVVCFGGSGYSNNAFFISFDGGQTMSPATDGLPGTAIHDLEFSPDDNWIFAATDAGPYAYLITENKWYYIGGVSAPIVEFYSVDYVADQNSVRFGTFGRGIWDFNISMDAATVNENEPITQGIFPNLIEDSQLSVLSAQKGQLLVYNMAGQQVLNRAINEGQNNVNHNLTNGIYVYAIVNDIGIVVKNKFEVKR